MQFEIRMVTEKDETEVLDLILNHFSRDFYRNWLGLEGEEVDLYNIMRAKKKLIQNWSLGAFEKSTNKLIGVELVEVQERGKTFHPQVKDFPHDDLQLSKNLEGVVKFFEELEEGVFDLLNANKLFVGGMGTVHKSYRHQGVLHKLTDKAEELMAISGSDCGIGTPTNEYLCRMHSHDGYHILREINYFDYFQRTGLNIFAHAKYPYVKAQLVYKSRKDFSKL